MVQKTSKTSENFLHVKDVLDFDKFNDFKKIRILNPQFPSMIKLKTLSFSFKIYLENLTSYRYFRNKTP